MASTLLQPFFTFPGVNATEKSTLKVYQKASKSIYVPCIFHVCSVYVPCWGMVQMG